MKIAIQGIAGSFHHQATERMFEDALIELVPALNFKGVFQAVEQGAAEYGVVAIENNLYGSINEVYRLLHRHHVWVSRELRMHIGQCLIGRQSVELAELAAAGDKVQVLSQAPALAQVELWLDEHLPQAVRLETHDTAESVKYATEQASPYVLAVAGETAAATYGGTVVAKNINDDPDNYTRFMAFTRQHHTQPNATAMSMIMTTDHSPGALGRALQILSAHELNLTKLDSHPIAGDQQHYAFYIDIDAPYEAEQTQAALNELVKSGCSLTILGSYTRY